MPLQQIAHQIITLADRRASTPVLVTPPYLSFRKQFFAELSRELADHTERDLRIDWYRKLPSVRTILSDQLAAWHVKSVNRLLSHMTVSKARQAHKTATNSTPAESAGTTDINLSRQPALDQPRALLTQHATVQITATIARPGGQGRDLVIGLSDARQKLPNWTTAIWLGTSAQEVERWQAA